MRCLLLLALLCLSSVTFAADRPNVLLIFIDDLKPLTRDYGHEQMQTPNFDRLAESGIRFENAYCQVPTCGASRASLMTSLYPTPTRFVNFLARASEDAPRAKTLPQRFREAGYHTVSNGKVFHHQNDTGPRSWSEPAWRPEINGKTYYNDATRKFMETVTEYRTPKGGKRQKKVPMFEQGEVDALETSDGLIAAKTIGDLKRLSKSDKPFFIACGFAKPHMPFFSPMPTWTPYPLDSIETAPHRKRPQPTPKAMRTVREQFAYIPMTPDLSRRLDYNTEAYHKHMRQGYYASVTHADDLTGRLLDTLEQLDIDDETIVLVLGDHGWLLGEHNEWAKNQLLHEALRTAFWMSGPGIERNAVAETFVEFVDIHPTLCELAGIEYDATSINGKSFAHVLKDPAASHRDHAYTRFGSGDALTSKESFFVRYQTKQHGREHLLIDRAADPLHKRNVSGEAKYAETTRTFDQQVQQKIDAAKRLPKKQ